MHKPMMHSRRIKVIAGVCPAVAVLPYTTKWHATRCPVVQKALTKAMQIGPFRLIVLISSRGVEDLCLGKNVPWQLAALIEDQKCMEVGGRQWCIYVVLHRRVNAAAKALATLASKPFMNIFISGSAVQCSVKMEKRTVYAWGVAILCFVVLMIVTPAIPQSQAYHDFADKREFFETHGEQSRDREQSRAETELTGGGGSERQRVEERESGAETKRREIEWLRKVREKIFKFEIYAKRRRFGSPRTGPVPNPTRPVPDPYQNRTGNFFFWPKSGTPGVRMQRYPGGIRTHDVPGTGIPNTLNVVSNFPFLVIGIIGLVFCYYRNYFKLSLQGELWGWTCFYLGVAAVAFGSSYYHLKPNDARLVWDRLPMTIAFTSIIAIFIIERVDEQKGTISIIPLLLAGIISILFFDDLRPYALIQFVPCIAIPVMAILLPPMYTHSTYWLWAAVFYLLAKVEEAADDVIYEWTHHIVSGHTLKHLCAAMVPVFLTLMLAKRSIETER
uniref:Ceramidase n=1 Tax=Fagus sylvatica TaxID=28930 RepID=A0A2N9IY60_FAGSY